MSRNPAELEKGALIATAGTALSRLTGFLRLASMTYALGVVESRLADTYALANTTPNIVYELVIGGVLSSVLQRAYVEVRQEHGQEEAWLFLTRLVRVSSLLLVAIAALGVLLAPVIFGLYTPGGASYDQQRMAGTFLLRLFIPQIVFYGFGTISTAVLNAHRRYGPPMLAPVLNNLVVIATFITFAAVLPRSLRTLDSITPGGLLLLGLGTTAGVLLQGITPWFYMRKVGYTKARGAGIVDPKLRRLARMSIYMVGYVVTNQLGLWIAMKLANNIQGGVASYAAAFVFFQLPHGLLAVSIAVVIFTAMTESAVAGDLDAFARHLNRGLRAIAFCIVPAAAGYIALAPKIVALTLEHGLATAASTAMIATTLRAWAAGIFFFSTFYLILRAFYSLGDTRTPMFINIAAFLVNVVVNLALFFTLEDPRLRVAGLAVGHATSYLVASVIGLIAVTRRTAPHVLSGYGSALVRITIASAFTASGAFGVSRVLASAFDAGLVSDVATVTVSTVVGLLIYGAASKALRLEEMGWIANLVLRRAR